MLTKIDALDPQLLYNHHKNRIKAHVLIMKRSKEGKVSIPWEFLEARLRQEWKLMRSYRDLMRRNSYYGKLAV